MAEIVVTGMGLCTALGEDPVPAMATGGSGVKECADLANLPLRQVARIESVDLRPWLLRRKDKKLMARPSQLALAAAGPALRGWSGPTEPLGVFLGVGWEPGDGDDSEPALVAAQVNGKVDVRAVAGRCRDLYPPLLPLKTLPNMALAHMSIHLGVHGENGAWTGRQAAGLVALRSAIWAVREGRVPAALVVAADSWTTQGAIKAWLSGVGSADQSPGEAGVALLIEPESSASARGADIFARLDLGVMPDAEEHPIEGHHGSLGVCAAADGLLSVSLAIAARCACSVVRAQDPGQPPVEVSIEVESCFACYPPQAQGVDA